MLAPVSGCKFMQAVKLVKGCVKEIKSTHKILCKLVLYSLTSSMGNLTVVARIFQDTIYTSGKSDRKMNYQNSIHVF